MNIVADEGVDRQIVERLREDGHLVLYIAEHSPSISDDAVLDIANTQQAVLLTADKDFGELVFRLRRVTVGVVLLRLEGLSPETKAMQVSTALRDHSLELSTAFSVISPGAIRIRQRR